MKQHTHVCVVYTTIALSHLSGGMSRAQVAHCAANTRARPADSRYVARDCRAYVADRQRSCRSVPPLSFPGGVVQWEGSRGGLYMCSAARLGEAKRRRLHNVVAQQMAHTHTHTSSSGHFPTATIGLTQWRVAGAACHLVVWRLSLIGVSLRSKRAPGHSR